MHHLFARNSPYKCLRDNLIGLLEVPESSIAHPFAQSRGPFFWRKSRNVRVHATKCATSHALFYMNMILEANSIMSSFLIDSIVHSHPNRPLYGVILRAVNPIKLIKLIHCEVPTHFQIIPLKATLALCSLTNFALATSPSFLIPDIEYLL